MAVVLVDMDGCLVNLWDSVGALMQRNGFIPVKEADLKDWDIEKIYKDHILRSEAYRALNTQGVFLSAQPREGAIDAFRELATQFDVFLVTTPWMGNRSCAEEKQRWVQYYLGVEHNRKLVITHDKTIVRGDVLIDDKPEITGCTVPEWKQILFHQGYNANINKPRIRHWDQAAGVVDVIAKMSDLTYGFTAFI